MKFLQSFCQSRLHFLVLIAMSSLFSFSLSSQRLSAQSSDFSHMVIFGDSLSDNGNLFNATGIPAAPYWQGRFSNGPLWCEQLQSALGIDNSQVENIAWGSATLEFVSILEVDFYISSNMGNISSDALYTLWVGGNDFKVLIDTPFQNTDALITDSIQSMSDMITALHQAGARTIVVPNLPDMSSIPRSIVANSLVERDWIHQECQDYNDLLVAELSNLRAQLDSLSIVEVNIFDFFEQVAVQPASFGISNWTDAAYENGLVAPNSDHYLFWDDIHPTTYAHSLIMDLVIDQMSFNRGDSNLDGTVNLADCLHVLDYLFSASSVAFDCADAADSNDDGNINLGDPIYLLAYLFSGGSAPPAPGLVDRGMDATADSLRCTLPLN